MNIELLSPVQSEAYEQLLSSRDDTLIYSSLKFKTFLSKISDNAQPLYLIATEQGRIIGALPSFIKIIPSHGAILNSLPFYGSNGGVIVAPEIKNPVPIKRALIHAFNDIAKDYQVRSSTIITNPLDQDLELYATETGYSHLDKRHGQFTMLPKIPEKNFDEALIQILHQKTRNMVRKGQKGGFDIFDTSEQSALDWLYQTHNENITAIGGLAKPQKIFQFIRETFDYGTDYKIYVGKKNDKYAAALLAFYYGNSVEYYTPVIDKEFRNDQVLSAIIFQAMRDAALAGRFYWNWGGTWITQESVYHFKKRWGTVDLPYYYFTKIYDLSLLELNMPEILSHFPYFYAFPFADKAGNLKLSV